VFFGEGGVGKNLLVDTVLYTLFNRQTVSAIADNLVGNFNSLLKGKMIAMINETVVGKHDNSRLTNQLNKKRFEVNEKGVPQYEVENTPLYMIGSQDQNGGALLSRTNADRRLSILRCEAGQTLPYWIARHEGINEAEALEWLLSESNAICSDPDQVAQWIHCLIETYGKQKQPTALHGADFNRIMGVQEGMEDRIARAVFMVEDFKFIRLADLYEGYVACCKAKGTRFTLKDKSFDFKIEMWLKANTPHIIKDTSVVNYYDIEPGLAEKRVRKQRQKTVWLNTKSDADVRQDNKSDYFDMIGYVSVFKFEV
jgi:hypothetical protein